VALYQVPARNTGINLVSSPEASLKESAPAIQERSHFVGVVNGLLQYLEMVLFHLFNRRSVEDDAISFDPRNPCLVMRGRVRSEAPAWRLRA